MKQEATGAAFRDVDRAADAGKLVGVLDSLRDSPDIQVAREHAVNALQLGAGDSVLEIGCGAGDMIAVLHEAVGPSGRATGVDLSETMVAQARRRARENGARVDLSVADATALPFARDAFDGCSFERVLIHVNSPEAVVAEIARVLKPGGRVVGNEPDWDTFVFDLPDFDVMEKVRRWQQERNFRNGRVGRQLARLFADAGLTDISVTPMPALSVGRATDITVKLRRMNTEQARDDGYITAEESARHLASIDDAISRGRWFSAFLRFVVSAKKPLS